ncbi:glycerol-3-phosphate dehydrogenase [Neomegalonema sp.]|uniref:glycerol-3-phosphate dehydrogenase n=1 Tax=Neomegalonema sp. TaxID=2039713 RepID=UPI002612B285|nr:glycerol-3-phosphate dehydrogenase [Neomegalonema sp.]MDD2868020.1 glycerol-3-phosphate dehydrogenase [Neomegalonema sp.]
MRFILNGFRFDQSPETLGVRVAQEDVLDLFVIGGGINGCGVARDAVGRGYRVGLAEMGDLASGTSSGATKLIHGGLRYLEHYEFRLVREALRERETLWAMTPNLIRPMRFVLPMEKGGPRPAWMIRAGLFLYDNLGGRKLLPATSPVDLRKDPLGAALKPEFGRAYEYSDGWVDDARLTLLNARDAADKGAEILTRAKVVSARREGGLWRIDVEREGAQMIRRARMLVNAAGPWADIVLREALGRREARHVRLVQGSHIVTRRRFPGERAFFFQNPDGRILFAIPYERDFTLIGTTDQDFTGDPSRAQITPAETDYLIEMANAYLREPIGRADVVWSYAAVRPLYDDGAGKAQEATRDYVLNLEAPAGEAPLLDVFGGKLTTYRRLAESALEKIGQAIGPKAGPWTAWSHLPGGDFPVRGLAEETAKLLRARPFLGEALAERLMRLYGLDSYRMLEGVYTAEGLGRRFGADLHEAELRWMMTREWAFTAEDVLWRRSKLGLRFTAQEAEELEKAMAEARRAAP